MLSCFCILTANTNLNEMSDSLECPTDTNTPEGCKPYSVRIAPLPLYPSRQCSASVGTPALRASWRPSSPAQLLANCLVTSRSHRAQVGRSINVSLSFSESQMIAGLRQDIEGGKEQCTEEM